jgi:flagellar biosynthesis/type III secretory pathway chaperone
MGLNLIHEGTGAMMGQVFSGIKGNTTNFQMELDCLQCLADVYNLLLFILIVDQNRKEIKEVNGSIESQELPCAFILLDKDRRNYFPLYMMDKNNCKHTIFCTNDDYISARWEELIQCVNQSRKLNIRSILFFLLNLFLSNRTY